MRDPAPCPPESTADLEPALAHWAPPGAAFAADSAANAQSGGLRHELVSGVLAKSASATLSGLAGGLRLMVDWIYPPSCMACGAATALPQALCATCWRALPLIERPFCDRLGTPFAVDHGPALLSAQALADPPVFGRARAVTRYDGLARDLVHRLKYGDRHDLAAPMGRWMARAGADILHDAECLVPVPLHGWRAWRRRANQAALLASQIGLASGRPVVLDALARVKATRSQVGLSRAERGDNLQGAFRVPPQGIAQLAGRHVVLVDDVLTTGATANAASRVLLRAGAARVDVLVFARVALAT